MLLVRSEGVGGWSPPCTGPCPPPEGRTGAQTVPRAAAPPPPSLTPMRLPPPARPHHCCRRPTRPPGASHAAPADAQTREWPECRAGSAGTKQSGSALHRHGGGSHADPIKGQYRTLQSLMALCLARADPKGMAPLHRAAGPGRAGFAPRCASAVTGQDRPVRQGMWPAPAQPAGRWETAPAAPGPAAPPHTPQAPPSAHTLPVVKDEGQLMFPCSGTCDRQFSAMQWYLWDLWSRLVWQCRHLFQTPKCLSLCACPISLLQRYCLGLCPVSRAASMTVSLHAAPIMHLRAFHQYDCSRFPRAGLASELSPDCSWSQEPVRHPSHHQTSASWYSGTTVQPRFGRARPACALTTMLATLERMTACPAGAAGPPAATSAAVSATGPSRAPLPQPTPSHTSNSRALPPPLVPSSTCCTQHSVIRQGRASTFRWPDDCIQRNN